MPAHAQPTQSGSNNIAASDNGRTGSHDRGQESPSGEEAEQGVQLFDERTTSEELREVSPSESAGFEHHADILLCFR